LDAQSDGIGLLISSHQLNALENISDKVVYLDDGVGVSEEINKDEYSKYHIALEDIFLINSKGEDENV